MLLPPKQLFWLDGLGGLLTASLLFFILGRYEPLFGMPQVTLNVLSLVAIGYALYSLSCSFLIKQHWSPYLYVIAGANSLYCLTTGILIFLYYEQLTRWGLIYFSSEIIIIGILVYWELKSAHALS